MTTNPAPIYPSFIPGAAPSLSYRAFAVGAAFLFCLFFSYSTIARAQADVVPPSSTGSEDPLEGASADTASESVSQDSTEKSTPGASFVKADDTLDKYERPNELVRYLVAGGLLLGGLVLSVPPVYYLAAGDSCTKYDDNNRCSKHIRPAAWYDYAGLTLGSIMVVAGVAVLVWPTQSAAGERATTVVLHGQF